GKERPIDLLLPVLPAAPPRDGRQRRVEAFTLELLAHHLLVPGARPDREPGRGARVAGIGRFVQSNVGHGSGLTCWPRAPPTACRTSGADRAASNRCTPACAASG